MPAAFLTFWAAPAAAQDPPAPEATEAPDTAEAPEATEALDAADTANVPLDARDPQADAELIALARAEVAPAERVPGRLKWDPEWREFTWEDWVITSAALTTALSAQFIPVNRSRWRRADLLFDEAGRKALRLRDEDTSLYARDASDVLISFAIMYPVLVDSMAVAWWYKQSPEVAREIALISAETLAVTSALQSTVSGLASRERPYGRRCGDGLSEQTKYCKGSNRFRSFFSGHTSMSFASAGVMCSHHLHLPLYGSPGDQLACTLGFVNAGVVGALRILSDQHYVSDVLVGASVGTLTGLGLPWLLHYRPSSARGFTPPILRVTAVPGGLGLGGEF